MDKVQYTEYSETLRLGEEVIEVMVQIPDDPELPAYVIDKSGSRFLRRTLDEWCAINTVVRNALRDAGWDTGVADKAKP